MKFLAWFETNCLTRRNAYFCAGSGIAANARFPGPDAEDAESAELDAITAGQGLLKSFKDRVYGCLGFSPRQACPFDNVVHNILLDQCPCPSIEENFCAFALRLTRVPYWRDAIGSWFRCQSSRTPIP